MNKITYIKLHIIRKYILEITNNVKNDFVFKWSNETYI